MASRFAQLLLLCLIVVFLPTFLYLRPAATAPRNQISADHQWYGTAGSLPEDALAGGSVKGATQGTGPLADDHSWSWPSNLVDPARLKAGDYWKSWKASWKGTHADTELVRPGVVPPAVDALPKADGANAFASKMGNATAKAELGRATWRFLHTMTLRFPDHPTPEQRDTLSTFFHTFSLLYPCGECANHFQALLKDLPPQTSSRMAASLWLCSAHNRVNARLGKPEFPCDKLDETYDCGCGPTSSASAPSSTAAPQRVDSNIIGPLPPAVREILNPSSVQGIDRRRSQADVCGLCQIYS